MGLVATTTIFPGPIFGEQTNFSQEEVLALSRQKSLRETLDALDQEFSQRLQRLVTRPPIDYLAYRNALRPQEEDARLYTEDHIQHVKDLFDRAGEVMSLSFGVTVVRNEWRLTSAGHRLLWAEFRDPHNPSQWVCVFLARLPHNYNQVADGCLELLKNK